VEPPPAQLLEVTFSFIAISINRGLETAIVAPLCITAKSERHASHAEEPNDGPSTASPWASRASGETASGRCPSSCPMPRAPMASGSRAPVDSPMMTSGTPRSVAVRFMCATFLLLVALVEAPLTVKSLITAATSRPADLARSRRSSRR
jgi:hypothetical protein